MWVYSNVDVVELFVNGMSLGVQVMPEYDHVEWDNIPFVAGTVQAVGYKNGTIAPVATAWRNTTGPAAALRISVKDGVGSTMVAGCQDVGYIQVAVVDGNGAVVPDASNEVTFTVSGVGGLLGTGNGDPSCVVNNKSPVRPAFHGLVLGVVSAGDVSGLMKVQASAPGLGSVSLVLTVEDQPAGFSSYWCPNQPRL